MQVSRRSFLTGRIAGRAPVLRPPGASDAEHFALHCDGCGRCATACPSAIVSIVEGLAALDFSRGECSLCGACAEACPTPALTLATPPRAGHTVSIGPGCLALRGVECRVCGERCEIRAIRFLPRQGGVRLPQLDAAACTGCGACFAPCPVAAIEITPLQELTA